MTDTRMSWFNLARHDDPPADPPTDPPADPPVDPPADDKLGDAGKKALQEERAARKAAEKALAEREAKLREYEDRDKTEAEKLAAKAEQAEKRAQTALTRAVKAEVKALAVDFADPTDAESAVNPADYLNANGDIDTDAIKTKLAELLEAKPHWRKAPTGPRNPAPDPSQGRGGNNEPTDYRKASQEEFGAELAKLGLRPRSFS